MLVDELPIDTTPTEVLPAKSPYLILFTVALTVSTAAVVNAPLPNATEFLIVACEFAPTAIAPVEPVLSEPLENALRPIAISLVSLAVTFAPIPIDCAPRASAAGPAANEPLPNEFAAIPIAVEAKPFACVCVPNAVLKCPSDTACTPTAIEP